MRALHQPQLQLLHKPLILGLSVLPQPTKAQAVLVTPELQVQKRRVMSNAGYRSVLAALQWVTSCTPSRLLLGILHTQRLRSSSARASIFVAYALQQLSAPSS